MPGFRSELAREKIEACQSAIDRTKTVIEKLSADHDKAKAEAASFYDAKVELNQLISKIKEAPNQEAHRIRSQISARLKSIVAEVTLAPRGIAVEKEAQMAMAKRIRDQQPDHPVLAAFATDAEYERMTARDTARFFQVNFKNGTYRAVFPHAADPQRYEEQYFVTQQKMGWLSDSGSTTHFLVEGEASPPEDQT